MEPMTPEAVEPALARFVGTPAYLHLETTVGAYTAGAFGAFARNLPVVVRRAAVRATADRHRVGLQTDAGWIYAEGLTHWELDGEGRLLLAGYDGEGRVNVVCELSAAPFPMHPEPLRLAIAAEPAGGGPWEPPSPERQVLVVLAHPDDETFGCAGTIALYTRAGVPVTCAIGTRGEMGRNMGNPFFATRETLHQLRERELAAACAVLGVTDLRLLGCWDKTSEFLAPGVVADRILALLEELRPTLVITHHPEFGGHPDHCAIGAATVAALGRLPAPARPRLWCLIPPRLAEDHGLPLETLDVSAVVDIKEAAVRAHRSQSEAALKRLKPEERQQRRERIALERHTVHPPSGDGSTWLPPAGTP